ncbi:MAG: hypothetical protein HC892_09040 [Saprospiraceae bacterium]|nr:hypothetical protein [Saprospiraceae bacterium]
MGFIKFGFSKQQHRFAKAKNQLINQKLTNQIKKMHLKGIFVIGRQHSGNTFLAKVIGESPDFFFRPRTKIHGLSAFQN